MDLSNRLDVLSLGETMALLVAQEPGRWRLLPHRRWQPRPGARRTRSGRGGRGGCRRCFCGGHHQRATGATGLAAGFATRQLDRFSVASSARGHGRPAHPQRTRTARFLKSRFLNGGYGGWPGHVLVLRRCLAKLTDIEKASQIKDLRGFFIPTNWWAVQVSNLRPLQCECSALPLS